MIRFRVEGEYLDQFKKEPFAITKAISKIGNVGARHGDRSTNFSVPLTDKNASILRYVPELNNVSDVNNFDRYSGQLIEDNLVISDGFFQVTGFNVNKKTVDLRFYGGNSDWFDLLKDRYLDDVITPNITSNNNYDLQDSNHYLNGTNIVDSWNLDKPYFYFLADNGKNSDRNLGASPTQLEDWSLGYFDHYLISKIFESIDVRVEGDIFNDPLFYETITTSSKLPISIVESTSDESEFRASNGTEIIPVPNENAPDVINFNIGGQNTQWNGNTFTANTNITSLRLRINLSVQRLSLNGYPVGSPPTGAFIQYRTNGGAWSPEFEATDRGNAELETRLYTIDRNIDNVSNNDKIEFRFGIRGDINTQYHIRGGRYSYFKIIEQGREGFVRTSELIPHIKQTDFIKEVLFRYGAITSFDQRGRVLTINKFENLEHNKVNSPDWSSKIDMSKDVKVDFTKVLSGYAKKSIVEYKDDSDKDILLSVLRDKAGLNLGDGVIDVDNDFLADEKSIYKSPLSATLSYLTFNSDWYLPFIPYFKNGEEQEVNNRCLVAKKLPVTSFNNGGFNKVTITIDGDDYSECGYAYFTKELFRNAGSEEMNQLDSNLMYGDNRLNVKIGATLLEKNYNLFSNILDKPYYIPMYFNLSSLDVQNVDFLTPIFLNFRDGNGYYYIDSIDQYKGDGSTTLVNLVKI